MGKDFPPMPVEVCQYSWHLALVHMHPSSAGSAHDTSQDVEDPWMTNDIVGGQICRKSSSDYPRDSENQWVQCSRGQVNRTRRPWLLGKVAHWQTLTNSPEAVTQPESREDSNVLDTYKYTAHRIISLDRTLL